MNPARSILGLVLAGLALLGCASPAPAQREPTAPEILDSAGSSMSRLTSFHFQLEVVNGTMPLGPSMVATSMEGDVVAPDRLQLSVKARMGNAPLALQVIAIGSRSFLTNPLNRQWQEASGSLVIPTLLDPDHGVGPTLRRMAAPERLGRETIDGVESYHLRGKIPAESLATLVGSREAASSPVAVDLWVDGRDFLLRQARLVGAILPEESALLERSLKVSNFNKTISIKEPIP